MFKTLLPTLPRWPVFPRIKVLTVDPTPVACPPVSNVGAYRPSVHPGPGFNTVPYSLPCSNAEIRVKTEFLNFLVVKQTMDTTSARVPQKVEAKSSKEIPKCQAGRDGPEGSSSLCSLIYTQGKGVRGEASNLSAPVLLTKPRSEPVLSSALARMARPGC